MKKPLLLFSSVVALCSFCFFLGKKQKEPKVCFTFHTDDNLRAGIANRISIFADLEAPIRLNQLSISSEIFVDPETIEGDAGATIEGDSGEFVVRVDTSSIIKITVNTEKGAITKKFDAYPISAVPKFGNIYGGIVSVEKFKTMKGMIAWVECCDFDARCAMLDYSIMRITKDNHVERAYNKGGELTEDAARLTNASQSGDIYWFRNITYRCFGDNRTQYGDDFYIEIQ